MATKAAEAEKTVDSGEELVDFIIPRTSPEDRAELIGVNGEFIRVLPGVQVKVKRKFAEAWQNSQDAQREAWENQSKAQARSKKALADL